MGDDSKRDLQFILTTSVATIPLQNYDTNPTFSWLPERPKYDLYRDQH